MNHLLFLLSRGKLLVALCLAMLLSLLLTVSASASAVTNTRQPFTLVQASPCTQEEITFTGDIHGIARTTLDGSGGFHTTFLVQLQGKGTGSSGTQYLLHDEITQQINGAIGEEQTFVQSFAIISQGSAPNLLLLMTGHMTINAKGEVTAFFDQFREECRG